MNQRQEKVRRKWQMSGNVWMFSNEIDDEDLEFMSHIEVVPDRGGMLL